MIPDDALPLILALSPYDPADVITTDTITYSFLDAGETIDTFEINGEDSISVEWTQEQRGFLRQIFDYYETIIDVTFAEITTGTANIEYQQVPFLLQDTTGFSAPISPGFSQIVIPADTANFSDVTLIHETAHSLGLSHPFDGPNTIPDSGDFDPGLLGLNNELVTRMSYSPPTAPGLDGLQINGTPFNLGAADVAALQLLYGANTTHNADDTTYEVTTGQLQTIWDTGGYDILNFNSATTAVVIDLRPATLELEVGGGGYLSYIQNEDNTVADGGFTIAHGVEIEAALGGAGNDLIIGNGVDNLLAGQGGDDVIIGGDGMDIAFFRGSQSSYTLTVSADGNTVTDRRGIDGIDGISSIESLDFGDDDGPEFDLTIFGGAQNLTAAQMESFIELYIAYFNRAPDAVGLNFWGTSFGTGTSLEGMAALFVDQPETRETYPAGQTNAELATAVYANVLGREGDEAGFNFWVGELDSGRVTTDQFILSVLEGAKAPPPADATGEELLQRIVDQGYLEAKTDIGAYYAVTKGLSSSADAEAAMALFDGTTASITAAQNAIDGYHTAALDAENGSFLMPLVGVLSDPFDSAVG